MLKLDNLRKRIELFVEKNHIPGLALAIVHGLKAAIWVSSD